MFANAICNFGTWRNIFGPPIYLVSKLVKFFFFCKVLDSVVFEVWREKEISVRCNDANVVVHPKLVDGARIRRCDALL